MTGSMHSVRPAPLPGKGGDFSPVHALVLAAGCSSRMGGTPKALLDLGPGNMLSLAVSSLRGGGVEHIHVITGHGEESVARAARELGIGVVHNSDFEQGMFSSLCAGFAHVLGEYENQHPVIAGGTGLPHAQGACLLLPVDAALVHSSTVASLVRRWRELGERMPGCADRALLIPAFAGRCGHPPLLGLSHLRAVLREKDTLMARAGLRGYMASLLRENAYRELLEEKLERLPWQENVGVREASPSGVDVSLPLLAAGRSGSPAFFAPLPDVGILSDLDYPHDCARARSFLAFNRERSCPVPEEAWEWLRVSGNEPGKIRHCLAVATGALRFAKVLERAGRRASPVLHLCGALLHDVMRGCVFEDKKCKAHARRARDLLAARGWPDCAEVVGAHTVLPDAALAALGLSERDMPVVCRKEAECVALRNTGVTPASARETQPFSWKKEEILLAAVCVYLADKYFFMDRRVSLEERFGIVKRRFAADTLALAAISHREQVAEAVAGWFYAVTGETPESALSCPSDSEWEGWLNALMEKTAL